MKTKFKLKLNQNELKAIGAACECVVREYGDINDLTDLISVGTCEQLWTRLRNMYRPDLDKYTLLLSAAEVQVLLGIVSTVLNLGGEPFFAAVGSRIGLELNQQVDHELQAYKAMRIH